MEQKKTKLQDLLATGEQFTYENFSIKGKFDYPAAYTTDFIAWHTKAEGAIHKLFGTDSAPGGKFTKGNQITLIGNGADKFYHAMSFWLGALRAVLDILEEDTFGELVGHASAPGNYSNKMFVVHGHDELAKNELEILIGELGFEPVVLHRQPDEGQTIIEKFEKHGDVGFVFILLTPDEISYVKDQDKLPDSDRKKEWRARPNVIFEFGYFVGRLGRSRVCCIYTGDVALPTDIGGILYKKYQNKVNEIAYDIAKELKAAGYKPII
jgi:predicted nucleotide-binding protein